MSTSDRRARDGDRDAAIELVEAALAAGRIVQADRDRRVEELARAQTMAEVYMHTRDLGMVAPDPVAEPPPTVQHGPPQSGSPQRSAGPSKALFLIPFAVVLVLAVAGIGAVLALSDVEGRIDSLSDLTPEQEEAQPADVLSVEGYAELLAAVEEQTGGTKAFDAVLYPEYAVVSAPVDDRTKRYYSWYWDGSELSRSSQGTSTNPRFDLARADAAVVVDLVERVSGLVDDPTSTYAIVRAPDADGAVVWAYASNAFSESAYLAARPDGTITYDSTEHD